MEENSNYNQENSSKNSNNSNNLMIQDKVSNILKNNDNHDRTIISVDLISDLSMKNKDFNDHFENRCFDKLRLDNLVHDDNCNNSINFKNKNIECINNNNHIKDTEKDTTYNLSEDSS